MKFNIVKRMKFSTKLLVSYSLVVILPVFFTVLFLSSRASQVILGQTQQIYNISLMQLESNISNVLDGYIHYSDSILADNLLLADLQTTYNNGSEYVYKYIDSIQMYSGKYKFYDTSGVKVRILTSNQTIVPDPDFLIPVSEEAMHEDSWMSSIMKQEGYYVIRATTLNEKGQKIVTIGRLLYKYPRQKYINILQIEIPEQILYELIEKEGSNKGIYLIDNNRIIVSSTDRSTSGLQVDKVNILHTVFPKGITSTPGMTSSGNSMIFAGSLPGNKLLENWNVVFVVPSDSLLQEIGSIEKFSLTIGLACVVISILFILLLSKTITKRLCKLAGSMSAIRDGKFDISVEYDEMDEIGELSRSFKNMIDRINRLISEVYISQMSLKDMKLRKTEAELNALQSQINPHFIFNTIESACMNLLKKDDEETADILRSFASILRKSIDFGKDKVTLKQELEIISDYLKIQKFRYRHKLSYSIDADSSLFSCTIPKFSIQPIVENAVVHGIKAARTCLDISIQISAVNSELHVSVADNGSGMGEQELAALKDKLKLSESDIDSKASIGLWNVQERIRLHYGENYGLMIDSQPGKGTSVLMLVPLLFHDKEEHDV